MNKQLKPWLHNNTKLVPDCIYMQIKIYGVTNIYCKHLKYSINFNYQQKLSTQNTTRFLQLKLYVQVLQ